MSSKHTSLCDTKIFVFTLALMAAMMSPPISAMWFLDLFIDHERSSRK